MVCPRVTWTLSHRAVLTTVCLSTTVCANAGFTLKPDNLRTQFREDPSLFFQRWGNTTMDQVLYSVDGSQQGFLDYLYPFAWEKEFDGPAAAAGCRSLWWLSYVVASLYLVGLWMGTSMMRDRKAFDLKVPLAGWNLFLAVFSFIGALRTVPQLAMMLSTYGFDYTICRSAHASYGSGAAGVWVWAFIYSKYYELIDTVFLVVRKKKVGFLHWYHHCSVLLYCWNAYVWEMPTGIYFVAMNYTVHAVMYFYYFLAAVCKRPPKWALAVTVMQLSQMAVGIGVTVVHLVVLIKRSVPNCDGHIPNLTGALGMYASYFILFAQFLFGRYCKRRDEKASSKLHRKLE